MKMYAILRSVLWVVAGALLAGAQPAGVEGDWEGVLKLPAGQLRLRIHIKSGAGGFTGTMDSPDQGAFGIALTTVSFAENTLKWELTQLRASYEGKLNAAGTEIGGTFTQGMGLPLTFQRMAAGAAAGPKRPQEPKGPFPYGAEEVTFASKSEGVTLAGTLTLPAGKGPHPAVILITGSGPQDRDEALMGHKPFLVLADHLSRRGVAVLRYDDRGIGKSKGSYATATSADFAQDAEGALEYLKSRAEIRAKQVGLAGHSEGGIIAPMVAARRQDVAFVVLLAGTAVPGSAVILEQGQALGRAAGMSEEQLKAARAKQMEFNQVMEAGGDAAELEKKLRAVLGSGAGVEAQIKQATTPWFRYFLTYDPAPALTKVKCPLLALNGEKDLQVLPDQNLPVMKAALEKGGNKDVTIVRLPGLNHLFQAAKTGAVSEYAQIEETMNPAALDAVSGWIAKHAGLEK